MSEMQEGSCFCGAVTIEAAGPALEMGYCHCSSCRAYSGAPYVAFVLWKAGDVTVKKGAELLGRFNKTGMTDRGFCTKCGGHLLNNHPEMGLTDVCAAALPSLVFEPSVHLNYAEAVVRVTDGLPKLKDFPAEAGGSGETLPE